MLRGRRLADRLRTPIRTRSGGVVGELQSALDALAAEDLSGMFGPALLERLGNLLRDRNRLDAQITRVVRECEKAGAAEFDGLKTMPLWLRGHARLSPAAASRLVRAGRGADGRGGGGGKGGRAGG